jgi:hypothetical protein
MRLNTSEKVIWAACFAARYGKEQARGVAKPVAARAAAAHASNALEALHTALPSMGEAERGHVVDVLGVDELAPPLPLAKKGGRR